MVKLTLLWCHLIFHIKHPVLQGHSTILQLLHILLTKLSAIFFTPVISGSESFVAACDCSKNAHECRFRSRHVLAFNVSVCDYRGPHCVPHKRISRVIKADSLLPSSKESGSAGSRERDNLGIVVFFRGFSKHLYSSLFGRSQETASILSRMVLCCLKFFTPLIHVFAGCSGSGW